VDIAQKSHLLFELTVKQCLTTQLPVGIPDIIPEGIIDRGKKIIGENYVTFLASTNDMPTLDTDS
jgi:hypothetical protein